ncbi:MAG: GldG family protein [Alphaproteobacteria bacterium]
MTRGLLSPIGLILAVILFVALNVASLVGLNNARVDLTENKLFTLSDGTRNLIAEVREPITLRFYFSEKLAGNIPTLKTYANRVREMLQTYVNASDGKIRLVSIDPEPFTDAEDDAVRAGIQAFPLGAGENLYFGLVGTNMVDDQETIAFFQQDKEPFLEYDLTKLIYALSDPKRPVVGLLTGHQMNADVPPMQRLAGTGPQPWAIVDSMRAEFTLKPVNDADGELPANLDVLVIVHPTKYSNKMLYAIDQYVMHGGKVVVYVDPVSEVGVAFRQAAQQRGSQAAPPRSELDTLLSAWGVKVDTDSVVGDLALAQQVNGGTPGNPRLVRYLPWLELGPENYNRDDVLMANLGPMVFASAAPMTPVEGAGTTFTPLITTSDQTMLFKSEELVYGASPVRLLEKFKPENQTRVIAARLTGTAKSAFPDGPLAEPEPPAGHGMAGTDDKAADEKKAPEKPPVPDSHLAASNGSINVIVVGEADNLFDQFWVRAQEFFGERVYVPTTSNGDFLINTLDNLAGSKDLISLRSRGKSTRPFEVVDGLRRDAEQRFLAEERDLTQKLEESQKRIVELRGKAAGEGGALLSQQQQDEILKAQDEVLNTRRQLRDVQRNLNKDIEALETRVKFVNIAGIPAVVAVVALVLAFARYQRRRRRAQG